MAQRLARQRARLAEEACESLRKPTARAAIRDAAACGGLRAVSILRDARLNVGDGASAQLCDELLRRSCNPKR